MGNARSRSTGSSGRQRRRHQRRVMKQVVADCQPAFERLDAAYACSETRDGDYVVAPGPFRRGKKEGS